MKQAYVWSPSQTDLCYFLLTFMFMHLHPMSYRWCWLRMDLLVLAKVRYVTPCKPWSSAGKTRSFHSRSLSLPNCLSCVWQTQKRYWFTLLPVTFVLIHLHHRVKCACVLFQLQMSDAMDNLEELLRLSGGEGQIFTVDGPLCMKSVQAMFGYNSAQPVYKQLFVFTFSMLTEERLAIVCLWLSLGSWLTMLTHPSMLSCTVGTCRQMFRSFLDLSLLWLTRRLSPYPERSAQVPSRLQMYWSTAQLYHFLKNKLLLCFTFFRFGNCWLHWNLRHFQSPGYIETFGTSYCCKQRSVLEMCLLVQQDKGSLLMV